MGLDPRKENRRKIFPALPFLLIKASFFIIKSSTIYTSVSGPDWILNQAGQWIRSGSRRQKRPTKISCFGELDFLFWGAEDLSCSLDVLYGGLGISELQFLIKKILFFFSTINFLVITYLDPDRYSALNVRSGIILIRIRNTDLQ